MALSLGRGNFSAIKKLNGIISLLKPKTYYTYSPEPAQPLQRDPVMVSSAKEAVKCIKSGKIFVVSWKFYWLFMEQVFYAMKII